MWVFSEIMGLPVEDRRLLISSATRSSATPTRRSSARSTCRSARLHDPRAAQAAVLEPVQPRPDRVRPPARRGPPRRAPRRHHDEARRGGGRRLTTQRARVRAVLHPAHDRRQRDDAAHDQARADRPARASGGARSPRRRSRRSPAPPPTRSCAGRTRCTTSGARRRRDVTVHGRRIKAGDKVTMWYARRQLRRAEVRRPVPLRRRAHAEPSPHLRSRRARTSASAPTSRSSR